MSIIYQSDIKIIWLVQLMKNEVSNKLLYKKGEPFVIQGFLGRSIFISTQKEGEFCQRAPPIE
jgi:hypothetical protein